MRKCDKSKQYSIYFILLMPMYQSTLSYANINLDRHNAQISRPRNEQREVRNKLFIYIYIYKYII